jgi:hypothetical protein
MSNIENAIILPNVSTILNDNRLPESIKEIKFVKIDNFEEKKETFIMSILRNIDQKKLKKTRSGDTSNSYNLTALKQIALQLEMPNNKNKMQLLIDITNKLKSAELLNENLPNIKYILESKK